MGYPFLPLERRPFKQNKQESNEMGEHDFWQKLAPETKFWGWWGLTEPSSHLWQDLSDAVLIRLMTSQINKMQRKVVYPVGNLTCS